MIIVLTVYDSKEVISTLFMSVERERERQRDREKRRETEIERQRERQRETESDRNRDRETHRQRERDREREETDLASLVPFSLILAEIKALNCCWSAIRASQAQSDSVQLE